MLGGKGLSNSAGSIVSEYGARMRLAKLGFTSNLNDLDLDKAEAFLYISSVIDDHEKREMERAKSKRR